MPLDVGKVPEIIKQETANVEKRYTGYNDDIFAVVAEVVSLEQQHSVQRFNIEQKISDQINTAALTLRPHIVIE
jgi:hypothetical protein